MLRIQMMLVVVLSQAPVDPQDIRPAGISPVWESVGLPLAPGRTARFQVNEATWMSLDVSPDGRTIVFDLLGHLYLLPIGGGLARQITQGMALNRQPRFSPDGRQLAFVSDRGGSANIWIADRDGRHARQLSNLHGHPYGAVTSPAWSHDGRTIVASQMLGAASPGRVSSDQQDRWLLAAYDVPGGQMRWVSDTHPDRVRAILGAVVAPEGKGVYAAVDAQRRDGPVEDWRVARIDLGTGGIRPEMWGMLPRVGMRPSVSPSGQLLVYMTSSGSRFGFRIRDLRTDRESWLVQEVVDGPALLPAYDSRDLFPGYAFTPDSRSVIAAYGGKIRRIDVASGNVQVIAFVANVNRELGPLPSHRFSLPDTGSRTRSVSHPTLSPDGQRVAFGALDRIWVMELPRNTGATGHPRRLTSDSSGEFYPSWSSDGQSIVYSTWTDGEGGAVKRTSVPSADGVGPMVSERLTSDTALYFHTAVDPKGRGIIAVRAPLPKDAVLSRSDQPPDPTLVWIPEQGGRPRSIARLPGLRDQPDYQEWYRYPVDQVYFTADSNRVHIGLSSWRLDGTEPRTAFTLAGLEDRSPFSAAGVLSPDGSRAIVVGRYTLFELSVPHLAASRTDTIDLQLARHNSLGHTEGAARRWGTALAPWVSWSSNGSRVLFSQGGTLFVGNVRAGDWTAFERLDIPLTIPVDVPEGILAFQGARLITMRGREVIERGTVIVQNNRIVAIGPAGKVRVPKTARVLSMAGKTIMPGYVDMHDHVLLPKGIHSGQPWECLTRLAHGVTTIRDPQPDFGVDVFTYRERERAGDLVCPRIFSTGLAYKRADPLIRELNGARDWIRANTDYYASESIKIHSDPLADRRTQQLLVTAAAELGVNAAVHGQGLELDLTVIIDGFSGLEHAPYVPIYDDVVTLIALSGTTHTQTYGAIPGFYYYMTRRHGDLCDALRIRSFMPPPARTFWCGRYTTASWTGPPTLRDVAPLVTGAARIAAKGGQVGIGSHIELPGLGFHYEVWLHAIGGMSNHDVLRSATFVGAKSIGHEADLGSLEVGKLADLQVLDQNPLSDIHHTVSIRYVMKNGRLYRVDDLTEIWPRHDALRSTYLWN